MEPVKRQERSAYIFYFVLAGILTGLLTISDSLQTDYVFLVAAVLVGSIYNWVTGLRNALHSLSCVIFVLGLWLWSWYRSTPDGERAPWWGSVLFVLPGLTLYLTSN